MKRYQAWILLLALSAWLLPQPIQAEEKAETHPLNLSIEDPWVVEPNQEIANQLYQEWLRKPQKPTKVGTSVTFNPCSCVSYARWKSGINVGPIGLAKYHPINSALPHIGDIIVTYESWAGHVGVVVGITTTTVVIDDYNYKRCAHTIRELPLDAKTIKGYYSVKI